MIELLIAIGVISILTAVSLPGIKDWMHNARLKSAARDLYSNFQRAKLEAAKTNREYALFFDTADNSYTFVNSGSDGDYSGDGNQADDNIDEQKIDLSSYGSGVKYGHGSATKDATTSGDTFTGEKADNVSHNNNVVVFNSRGMSNTAGYVYLSNDKNNLSYAIGTPNTITGNIVLRKWNGNNWQ